MQTTTTSPAEPAPPAPPAPPAIRRVAVPGGSARIVDEVRVPSRARPDESLAAQALVGDDGPLLRVGYVRSGRMLRGPVSATPDELAALVAALAAHPAFADALGTCAPDG